MKRTLKALAAAALLSVAALASGGTGAEAVPTLANMSRIDSGVDLVQHRRHCWRHCWWRHGHRHCEWRCRHRGW